MSPISRVHAKGGFTLGWLTAAYALVSGSAAAQAEESSLAPMLPEVHGFVSQGFIKTTDNNYLAESERGSFEFSEVGINFTKDLTERLRVGLQLFAHDLGPLGNYNAQFDWYYLDYRFWDWLGLRAGRTKLPFGLYNETNDIDAARAPILLPQSVYPIRNRDFLLAQTGAELYGRLALGGAGSVEYRAYGGTIFLDTTASASQIPNFHVPYVAGGRLMWQLPLEGLQVGGSAQALRLDFDFVPPPELLTALQMAGAVPPDFAGSVAIKAPVFLWVASLEYAPEDWLFAAEYSRWRAELQSSFPTIIPETVTTSERLYGMLSYRVTPWFTPGIYYSLFFPDVDQRENRDDYQHDLALYARYDLNAHWILKVEGHYMNGTAGLESSLNDNAPLNTLTPEWGILLIKTTAYF